MPLKESGDFTTMDNTEAWFPMEDLVSTGVFR